MTPPHTTSHPTENLFHLLGTHWRTLLLLFGLTLLPLWGFAEIAEQVFEKEPIPQEVPLMQWIHAHASATQDHVAATFSLFGSARGMIPLSILLFARLCCLNWPDGRRRAGVA